VGGREAGRNGVKEESLSERNFLRQEKNRSYNLKKKRKRNRFTIEKRTPETEGGGGRTKNKKSTPDYRKGGGIGRSEGGTSHPPQRKKGRTSLSGKEKGRGSCTPP